MFKKLLFSTALIALIGVLVLGIVNPSQAKGYETPAATVQGQTVTEISQAPITVQPVEMATQVWSAGLAPSSDPLTATSEELRMAPQGWGNSMAQNLNPVPAVSGELNSVESAALLYMREEEKLAHDVYVTLYAKWGLPVFQNISQSEQTHTDAIKVLLDRYGLTDPASNQVGAFTNPELQKLYTDLIARGGQSLSEALKVGAAIEEIDILDLQKRLAQTNHADIQQVYNNLLKGSANHLRAFVSTLKTQTGETYQPQYLTADVYQSIIGSTGAGIGNGRGYNRGNGQNTNGGGRRNTP